MGVYIKGMEMPKPKFTDMAAVYCAYVLVRPNGHVAIVVDNEDGLDSTEYPLAHVPPHGRLIDADALMKEIQETCKRLYGTDDISTASQTLSAFKFYIGEAPTIIESEG